MLSETSSLEGFNTDGRLQYQHYKGAVMHLWPFFLPL